MRVVHLFAVVAALCLFACSSSSAGGLAPPGQLGMVGSVVASSSSPSARPALLVRYDGEVFVAWAEARVEASVYWSGSEPRAFALPPRIVAGGRSVVRVRSTSETWEGAVGDPLPDSSRRMFSAEEIETWGLAFLGPPHT